MLLTESKIIKNKLIFKLIDKYSYQAKNLYNACNYIIKQASADVNGSYQIMRKVISLEYKGYERVERIKVA